MTKTTLITLLLVLGSCGAAFASMQKVAESVLDKLYKANGNQVYIKPRITLTDDELNAAQYLRRANTIELSRKAYAVCRSFGKDSLDALAFVLGHELSHAYQTDTHAPSTSFLAYDKYHSDGVQMEEAADVQGVFMAYLAGYKTAGLLPDFMERLYDEFGLTGKNLTGYPPLLVRQQSAIRVQRLTRELIRIYEAGNYLLAIGRYDLAMACFEYVEDHYKGREVLNNLGVAYALLAMNISTKNADPYLFPLEISWATRMNKTPALPGGKDLDPYERMVRERYLAKALAFFQKASKMDYQFFPAQVNMLCVLVLQADYNGAIDYYNRQELGKKALLMERPLLEKQKLNLALALAYSQNQEGEKATGIWKDLKKNGSGLVAFQADYNLKVWQGQICDATIKSVCPEIPGTKDHFDGININFPNVKGTWIPLAPDDNIQLSISEKPHSVLYTFSKSSDFFSLQRIFEPAKAGTKNTAASPQGLFTNMGVIVSCNDNGLSFIFDNYGTVAEWAKHSW